MAITIDGSSNTVSGLAVGGLPSGTITSSTLDSTAVYLTAPAGTVVFLAQSTAPTGWIKANGAAVSRTTYAALFTALGTTFGTGNGSTTFNLPDLRGYFPRGFDDGAGVDSGRTFGSNQADDFASHTHPYTDSTNSGGNGFPGGTLNTGTTTLNKNTTATGGTETRPKNLALLACIKY